MGFDISIKTEDCIGCGACVAVCDSNWELVEGKAHPKASKVEEIGCNQDAADTCPMNCIIIKEE